MRGPGQQYQGRPEAALSAYRQTRRVQQPRIIHVAICTTLSQPRGRVSE